MCSRRSDGQDCEKKGCGGFGAAGLRIFHTINWSMSLLGDSVEGWIETLAHPISDSDSYLALAYQQVLLLLKYKIFRGYFVFQCLLWIEDEKSEEYQAMSQTIYVIGRKI